MKKTFWRLLAAIAVVCLATGILWKPTHAATTVQLAPVPHMQFLSSTGAPLAAGCVYTYAAGTTTQLATYTDSTGNTVNSDPIQLDAGGFANIWLTGSAYKFAVYSNPNGGMCPGTPGGTLVLQWTVDNITTATSSGAGAATSLTSAAANPASAGIIRMAKSDTVCWRNAGNSGNLCVSLDANNILTWAGGSLAMTEIAAPSGVAGEDIIWADSTAHRWKVSNNGGAAVQLVVSGADINTSDQVVSTHLSAALPVAQGGTASTTATGSGSVVLANSPTLTTPTVNSPIETTPQINGIATNSSGIQFGTVSTGTINLSSGANVTLTWNTAFADTSYAPVCMVEDSNHSLEAVAISAVSASSVTVWVFNNSASLNISGTLACQGMHP